MLRVVRPWELTSSSLEGLSSHCARSDPPPSPYNNAKDGSVKNTPRALFVLLIDSTETSFVQKFQSNSVPKPRQRGGPLIYSISHTNPPPLIKGTNSLRSEVEKYWHKNCFLQQTYLIKRGLKLNRSSAFDQHLKKLHCNQNFAQLHTHRTNICLWGRPLFLASESNGHMKAKRLTRFEKKVPKAKFGLENHVRAVDLCGV